MKVNTQIDGIEKEKMSYVCVCVWMGVYVCGLIDNIFLCDFCMD